LALGRRKREELNEIADQRVITKCSNMEIKREREEKGLI